MKLYPIYEQLLTEKDDRRAIVNKLGLDQEVADAAHAISDKFSIWIANVAKNNLEAGETPLEFLTKEREHLEKIVKLFKTPNKPKMEGKWALKNLDYRRSSYLFAMWNYITDWAEHPDVPSVDLTQYTWDEAEEASRDWHNSLRGGGKVDNIDDGAKLIHKFPDGYYWAMTESFSCTKSGKSMQHCATASEIDMYLLHLRKNNEEFLTADWHPKEKFIIQLKGKQNDKPVPKYYKYILWLILDSGMVKELRTTQGYKPETNFQITDLPTNAMMTIAEKNPDVIDLGELLYQMDNPNEFINKLFGKESFVSNLSPSDVSIFMENSNNSSELVDILMSNSEFYSELFQVGGEKAIKSMLFATNNPDKLIHQLIDIGMVDELMVKSRFSNDNNWGAFTTIRDWLTYTKNPVQILKKLGKVGMRLITYDNIDILLQKTQGAEVGEKGSADEVLAMAMTSNEFIHRMEQDIRGIISRLQYLNNPEEFVMSLQGNTQDAVVDELKTLDPSQVKYLTGRALQPTKVANLMAKAGNPYGQVKNEPAIAGESIRQALRNELLLTEGASNIIYHFTGINKVINILNHNTLNLTSKIGSSPDDLDSKYYYMSFTRSKSSKLGYGAKFNFEGAVRMTFDGRKLNQKYKVKPVDYWQYPKTPQSMNQTSSDEMEDRLVSDDNSIPNVNKYIMSIDILMGESGIDESIITNCKSLGITLNLFDNKETFSHGNPKYAVKPIIKKDGDEPPQTSKAYGIEYIMAALTYKEPEIYDEIVKSLDVKTINSINEYHKELKYKLQSESYTIKEVAATLSSYITNNKQSADKLYRKVMGLLVKDFKKTGSKTILDYLESKIYKGKKRQADFNKELNDKISKGVDKTLNDYISENKFIAYSNDGETQYDSIYDDQDVMRFISETVKRIKNYVSEYLLTNNDKFQYQYKIASSELRDEFNITENNPEAMRLSEKFSDVSPLEIIEPILTVIWLIDSFHTEIADANTQLNSL